MAVKLMVPGELALVACHSARYAYEGRTDAPAGIASDSAVEFEVELVGFDREGYWQNLTMQVGPAARPGTGTLFPQARYSLGSPLPLLRLRRALGLFPGGAASPAPPTCCQLWWRQCV